MRPATGGCRYEPGAGTIRSRKRRKLRPARRSDGDGPEESNLGTDSLRNECLCPGRLRGENYPVAPAVFRLVVFCLVKCAVGDPQKLFQRAGVLQIHGDADRDGRLAQRFAATAQAKLTHHSSRKRLGVAERPATLRSFVMSGSSAVQQTGAALRVAEDITELMGQTPMLRLRRVARPEWAAVYAKLEFLNPGGSVKDRAALGMILDAERRGILKPGSTIVEATAGNTGVGLALVGVNRGYRVVLFVPEGFAEEKCILMRGFGATVIRTPETEGMRGAIAQARDLAKEDSNVFAALQFENQANPQFHHDTTAVEIWEQMEGRDDAFVAGIGTGGTFSGVARFLKEQNPAVVNVAVETQGSIL